GGPSRPGELLVLIGGELGACEAEPAPPHQPHRVGRAGPVEGPGHRRAPVDDDRMAVAVMDVTAPDVQPFARQRPPPPVVLAAPRRRPGRSRSPPPLAGRPPPGPSRDS